jgi:hypothetical protein
MNTLVPGCHLLRRDRTPRRLPRYHTLELKDKKPALRPSFQVSSFETVSPRGCFRLSLRLKVGLGSVAESAARGDRGWRGMVVVLRERDGRKDGSSPAGSREALKDGAT